MSRDCFKIWRDLHRSSVGGVGVVGGGGGVRHRPRGAAPHVAGHRARRRSGAGGAARPVGDASGGVLGGLVRLVGRLSPGLDHNSVHVSVFPAIVMHSDVCTGSAQSV